MNCKNCGREIKDKDEKICLCGHVHNSDEKFILKDERCECGNLVSKIRYNDKGKAQSIEIKCRRCKRIHVISVEYLAF